MALKKSDLYASLWASCDELRGGMDASLYKDYVLFMLFIKYISDKYGTSTDFAPPVTIPKGASFTDMIALTGKPDIGDRINTQIIQPLIDANARLARSDFPDFNDPNKLGEGQAMYLMTTQKSGLIALCGGSAFLEIGTKQLSAYEVRLPKDPTEQTAIAAVLSDMDAELEGLESRRDKTRALKRR